VSWCRQLQSSQDPVSTHRDVSVLRSELPRHDPAEIAILCKLKPLGKDTAVRVSASKSPKHGWKSRRLVVVSDDSKLLKDDWLPDVVPKRLLISSTSELSYFDTNCELMCC